MFNRYILHKNYYWVHSLVSPILLLQKSPAVLAVGLCAAVNVSKVAQDTVIWRFVASEVYIYFEYGISRHSIASSLQICHLTVLCLQSHLVLH